MSAANGRNLERLGQEIVDRLDVIRVYAKPPGEEPDLDAPFVIKAGSLLSDPRRMRMTDSSYYLRSPEEMVAMGIMGLGGLVAVIGGTLFVVLAFVAVFRGRTRQAAVAG